MADHRPPYHRRTTKPLPREELAPVATSPVDAEAETRPALEETERFAREAENDIVTLVRCPLCMAGGMVPPAIAATFDELCKTAKEHA